jgi:pimeloyl-ACP methyl ester carboxylesterase
MATYVLIHGGWDGGWSWRDVAHYLQAAGHEVLRPTLTGSGERVHLASPDIGLDTHVLDVVNVLRYEELQEVVLCASSYGGMVITGVAEQVPERIKQLIYVDAFVPEDGQSAGDLVGPGIMGFMEQIAAQVGDGWRVPHDPPDADRRTDFLLKAGQDLLHMGNPEAERIPRTYVQFTDKAEDDFMKPVFEETAARVKEAGWTCLEMPFEHWPFLDKPQEIAALLLELGAD